MRFEEDIHWAEGLFLQPHHLQRMQRSEKLRRQCERQFYLPYTWGLVDFEYDPDALANHRIVIKRLCAIMPSGEEVSMPGNCVIPPLELAPHLKNADGEIIVCLALPRWSEHDANLAEEDEGTSRRQFAIHENTMRDENSGDNEITVACHRLNVRLTVNPRDNTDLEVLPLMRLHLLCQEASEPALEFDREYMPPFVVLSGDCPLQSRCAELGIQMRQRRNKILHDLTQGGVNTENLTCANLLAMLQLRSLNRATDRLETLLGAGRLTPFALYLELKMILGELSALQPLREYGAVGEYDHMDCAPQFAALFTAVRSLIMANGVSSYIRLEFADTADHRGRLLKLKDEHLLMADEYYLAVRCSGDSRRIVSSIESGDNFKIVNPRSSASRIRGVKLTEMRYPPRFLPALPDAVWFKLERSQSQRVWSQICDEHAMMLDWAGELFPKLEAALYITVLSQK